MSLWHVSSVTDSSLKENQIINRLTIQQNSWLNYIMDVTSKPLIVHNGEE